MEEGNGKYGMRKEDEDGGAQLEMNNGKAAQS
jgi:hypothetical protein